jgi:proteasome lid subunit RPN8/RPN11
LADNVDKSSYVFSISPEFLIEIYGHADEIVLEVFGIFHPHPAPAIPSHNDLKHRKVNLYVWLMVSKIDWIIGSYEWWSGEIQKVLIDSI